MNIITLLRARLRAGRPRRYPEAVDAPAAKPERKKSGAPAVRREPKPPSLAPNRWAAELRRDKQATAFNKIIAAGLPVDQVPAMLRKFETMDPESFENELERRVVLPSLAEAAAARVKAAGCAVLVDPKAFVEHHLDEGSTIEEADAALQGLETESLQYKVPTYAVVYGDGTVESCRAKARQRARAPAGSAERRLAALLGEDKVRAEILTDDVELRRDAPPRGDQDVAAEAAQGYARRQGPLTSAATEAPRHPGYFRVDHLSGFSHHPRREEGGSGT